MIRIPLKKPTHARTPRIYRVLRYNSLPLKPSWSASAFVEKKEKQKRFLPRWFPIVLSVFPPGGFVNARREGRSARCGDRQRRVFVRRLVRGIRVHASGAFRRRGHGRRSGRVLPAPVRLQGEGTTIEIAHTFQGTAHQLRAPSLATWQRVLTSARKRGFPPNPLAFDSESGSRASLSSHAQKKNLERS